jgi:transposase
MPRTRRPYPSDLTDQEWNLLEPLLASPERRGRPSKWPARRIADAVFYLLRSGCAWRMLCPGSIHLGKPRLLPLSRKWRLEGRLRQAHERLRAAVRESEGRNPDPSGAVIDSQAVSRVAALEDLSAATMGRSVYPVENATCWWTPTGWCSVHKSMAQVCTTETVGGGFSTTSWPRICPG